MERAWYKTANKQLSKKYCKTHSCLIGRMNLFLKKCELLLQKAVKRSCVFQKTTENLYKCILF